MKINIARTEKKFAIILTWLFVLGSIIITEDKPICVFIISPPVKTAARIQFATKPIKAPKTKFKNIQRNIGVSEGGGVGLITPTNITVQIIAKDKRTIAGTSLLDKTGASLIIPTNLKKIIMPAPKAEFSSGNIIANCFKISSNY